MKKTRLGISGTALVALLTSGCGQNDRTFRDIDNVPEALGYDIHLFQQGARTSLTVKDFDDPRAGYVILENFEGGGFSSENRSPEKSPMRKLGSYEDFVKIYNAIRE